MIRDILMYMVRYLNFLIAEYRHEKVNFLRASLTSHHKAFLSSQLYPVELVPVESRFC